MALIAPVFSGTKVSKLQFHRRVYSTLGFSRLQQTPSVYLVFQGWGCKRLTTVLERFIFLFSFLFPILSAFIFEFLEAVSLCLGSVKLSSAASLAHCRSAGEAVRWRSLQPEPEASSRRICRRARLCVCVLFSAFSFPFLFLLEGAIKQLLC